MKLADLDKETLALVIFAHSVSYDPSPGNLQRLRAALVAFDKKHQKERIETVLKVLKNAKLP